MSGQKAVSFFAYQTEKHCLLFKERGGLLFFSHSSLRVFGDSSDGYIDTGDFVPGSEVYDTSLWKVEFFLECAYGLGCFWAVDTVCSNFWDDCVDVCNGI